ncbi:MAG: DUF1800 domain-containing protein [Dissulfurispiraceae bacterium]
MQAEGFSAYLNAQLALTPTSYPTFPVVDPNSAMGCPTGSPTTCYRDNYSSFLVQNAFFLNALTAPDQLRQRVAFALSQIFVVSNVKVRGAYAIRDYQQMLVDNAFGNFRTLLQNVTLSSAMGHYLDMVNNDKGNSTLGTEPNQNYAREVMQLFTIGLVKLNSDGTPRLDSSGNTIATYDQSVIEGFASVFTGWTYPTEPGATPQNRNPEYFVGNMIAVEADHDTGAKTLLDGVTLPANQTALEDLNEALDNIFNHPNVGPFIGKQLIQFLVTSNPSPAYVSRVAAVFNDDGNGVRGNMTAVIRAILLDEEARGQPANDPVYGQLREPAVFMPGVLRALGGSSDGVFLNWESADMEEPVFDSPSVFNFYPPSYPLPGNTTGLVAPQFAIQDAASTLTRWNFLNSVIYSVIPPDSSVNGSTGTSITWNSWLKLASNTSKLIDTLDLVLSGGLLDSASRSMVSTAVQAIPASDALDRVRAAAYLIAAAPQTMIQR